MTMTRVWNVTSDPSTEVPVQNLLILGRLLKPGQSIQIEEEFLKTAHKIKKYAEAGLLAIGSASPGYLTKTTRALLPKDLARGHGPAPVPAMEEPEKGKSEVKAVEAKAEAKTAETKVEEPKKEENGNKGFGKHKR